jgi:23S rRNA (adenine-N6)-dimethyltransferase
MFRMQRKLLSQNFLYSRKLVASLVGNSSIGKNDTVLEIGPGKGIITEQLLKRSKRVIAVELDSFYCEYLRIKFRHCPNFSIYHQDFLTFPLSNEPYKVFANIPFSIEGKIIRKLIDSSNPPTDCFLVMMKELAYRLGAPYKENQFSITHKPFFDFSIYHYFRKTDFIPMTGVDSVMLRFAMKKNCLMPFEERENYKKFVEYGFGQGLPIYRNLTNHFSFSKLDSIFQSLGINRSIRPSYLPLNKWVKLYKKIN